MATRPSASSRSGSSSAASFGAAGAKMSTTNRVNAVARALDILEVLATSDIGWLGATEVSRLVGIPRSTSYTILTTLADRGYADKDVRTKKYSIGVRAVELSRKYQNRDLLIPSFYEVAGQIQKECNETINLAVLSGRDVVYVAKKDSSEPLRMSADVGARVPAHMTALGKCLLGGLGHDEVAQLFRGYSFVRKTPNTIMSLDALEKELEAFRGRGYFIDRGEHHVEAVCVSAPVVDADGRTIAAISITQPKSRSSSEATEKQIALLKWASERLTGGVGHR
jgi:IclR family KDG regulon transcriptional repressor